MLPEVLQAPAVQAVARPDAAWHRLDVDVAGAAKSTCLDAWRRGTYTSTRSASARSLLAELEPHILAAARMSGDADEIIGGFDSLLRQLSVGAHLFRSLAVDPSALQTLLQLVARAPWLASRIAHRPDMFDALIVHQPSADVMSVSELTGALAGLKHNCATETDLLRGIQVFTRKHQFLVGARAVLSWIPLGKAEEGFSKLALAVVQALVCLAQRGFENSTAAHPAATGRWWRWGNWADWS